MAAVERIITEYIVQTDKARKELNRYENDLLQADKATQNSANKTQRTLESASQKRLKLLNEEKQDLAELTARRKQAYSVKEIREYNKRISETKDRINTLESAEGKLQKKTDLLGQTFKRVAVGIAAAFTVDRVISFTKESIKLAATSERVEQAFNRLSRPGLLNDLRAAVNGTVSDLQLMQNTVKAIEFGISQDQLPTFFAFAKQQADKLGVSVDYLVNSIIDGVGRKSSLVLDNLGISATEIQAEFKKTGDFAQAAANIIEQRMGDVSDSVDNAKDSIAQYNAALENAQVAFGKAFGQDSVDALNTYSGALNTLTSENVALKLAGLFDLFTGTGAVFRAFAQGLDEILTPLQKFENLLGQATSEAQLIQIIADVEAKLNSLRTALGDNSASVTQYEAMLKLATDALDNFGKKNNDVTAEVEKATGEIESDREAMNKLTMELAKFVSISPEAARLFAKIGLDDSAVKNIKDFSAELEKIFGTVSKFKNTDFKLKDLLDPPGEKQKEQLEDFLSAFQNVYGSIQSIISEYQNQRLQQIENEFALERDLLLQRQEIQKDILNQQLQTEQISQEEFLNQRQELNDELNKLDRQRQEEIRQQRRRQALADKAAAIFEIGINTGIAISKVLAQTGVAAPATIPLIIAQSAAAIAAVAARPIPEFAEGVIGLKGPGTETSDSIPAMLSKGESVMTAKETRENRPLLEAIRNDTLPKYIDTNFIAPALQEIQKKNDKGFAGNLAASLMGSRVQSIDDAGIIHAIRKNRNVNLMNDDILAKKIAKQLRKQNYSTNA